MKKQRNIRHPEKWIGKYVRHMANWQDFQWGDTTPYFVCEWTGKLYRIEDEYTPQYQEREQVAAYYDPCYWYSHEAIIKMIDAA